MALTTIQIINIKCPDLGTDPNLSIWITLAQEQTDSSYFCNSYNLAVALRACHEYTLVNMPGASAGASGNISSIKEGDLSIGYSNNSSSGKSSNNLDQTIFGKELKALIKQVRTGIAVLGAGTTLSCS
jgi:hypothetical protein